MATPLRVFLSLNVGHVVSRGLRRSWAAKTITSRAYVARATQQVIAGEPRLIVLKFKDQIQLEGYSRGHLNSTVSCLS